MSLTYQAFIAQKEEAFNQVTEDNAQELLDKYSKQVGERLDAIDVNDISSVEAFYLEVAVLMQAAACVAAINKAADKDCSFEDALKRTAVDETLPVLVNSLANHIKAPGMENIMAIDRDCYRGKEAWGGLHSRLNIAISSIKKIQQTVESIKDPIKNYRIQLEQKLQSNGLRLPLSNQEEPSSPYIKKLIQRYEAIKALEDEISNKSSYSQGDIDTAEKTIKNCIDLQPEWSERPFLQKLADILSLGLLPGCRTFFSEEKRLQKSIEVPIDILQSGCLNS